jgi:hypothetical protein
MFYDLCSWFVTVQTVQMTAYNLTNEFDQCFKPEILSLSCITQRYFGMTNEMQTYNYGSIALIALAGARIM